MLIVLSAAARFHAKPVTECAVQSVPRLASKAKALAQELRRLEAKDIKKQLHVNDALAKQYEKHLTNFEAQKTVPACCLYDSPLFNALAAPSFDEEDAEWANKHIRIFSGLYGFLRPFDEIQPLGLPVSLSTKLKNSKGNFLKDYWQEPIMKEVSEGLKRLPMPVIVNCGAVEDDMKVLDQEHLISELGTRIASVDFKFANKDDAAEARGEFVRWAIEQRCFTVEELLEFKGLGVEEGVSGLFRVNPKASSVDSIMFEPDGGGDGGWSTKMAEYSGSKKAFMKEEASGKNRYKRTEINKAIVKRDAKETKKNRKANAVY